MSGKYSFALTSQDRTRELPGKIIVGRQETETIAHVALKLLGFVYFYRPRLQLETNLHSDNIPFVPDLVELDYNMVPKLWVECGDCGAQKLDKLAVKVPQSEIWVVNPSASSADELVSRMEKAALRRNRYKILALDADVFTEFCALIVGRNQLLWVKVDRDENEMHFDFNGLWFQLPFALRQF